MIKLFNFIKIIFINISVFLVLLIFLDLIFGSWFKNNFNLRLSSERNIYRVYKFDFKNNKGDSLYIRNDYGFRVKNLENFSLKKIDVVFAGGSTTNQKFVDYDNSIVGILQNKLGKINFVNAGVDGMSIVGHINSFKYWFNKIDKLNPKYYIFYIGINDQHLSKTKNQNSVDFLIESSTEGKIREYMEANSFFYKKFRKLKTSLYLNHGFLKGANQVNKKTKVYGERPDTKFIQYNDYQKNPNIDKDFQELYENYLNQLTKLVLNSGSKIIYIPQLSGNGINNKLFNINETIVKHCLDFKLICFNLPKEVDLNYNDFYDWAHLNVQGSTKVAGYIYKKLLDIDLKK